MSTNLPPSWAWASLADLGLEIRGQVAPQAGTTYDLYSVPAFPGQRPERIDGAGIRSGKREVESGDVLLCKINPRINRVWSVGEPEGRPQVASTEYLVLRPYERAMGPFIQQYLSSPPFRKWIELSVEGATGSHTRAKSGPILQQPIPVAPLDEQKRIVAAIEEHFSRLDAAEESIRAVGTRVSDVAIAAIQQMFSQNWPTRRIGEIARVGSGATPKRSESRYWSGGTIPWITSGATNLRKISSAREFITEDALAETSVKLWPPGTVLVAMYGEGKTRGKAAISQIPATCNQACAAVDYDRELVDGEYLLAYVNSQYEVSRKLASGGVQPNLSLGLVKSMEIPLPSLRVQQHVARRAEEILEKSEWVSATCATTRKRSDALRRSLLGSAFSGRLVPQDPDEEPASALLDRIAASRPAKPARRRART